ncbi:MAG: glycosyltransferase family 2 protein [Desulfovibrio sp.]|jgi:glycosyltransferase involved in cell wall biosynthesis|nr:glycosyltransferase family 2 protein [Desulfovibrio sp.]
MTQATHPQADPLVSIIIPVYNEEKNISILWDEISRAMRVQNRTWEIVFVDDGSRDAGLDIIRRLATDEARIGYVAFEENRGQSAAFAAGFREARGEIFVTLDSDLQNDPADIPHMLDVYEREGDMIIGWRAKRRDTLIKRFSSKIANAVRNFLSRENVRDTGCSLKVMQASLARRLPMFTGMHRFFPTLMKMQGAKVTEVQVNHRPRRYGHSKYGVWDRAFSAFYDLLAVRWMQARHIAYHIKERSRGQE